MVLPEVGWVNQGRPMFHAPVDRASIVGPVFATVILTGELLRPLNYMRKDALERLEKIALVQDDCHRARMNDRQPSLQAGTRNKGTKFKIASCAMGVYPCFP